MVVQPGHLKPGRFAIARQMFSHLLMTSLWPKPATPCVPKLGVADIRMILKASMSFFADAVAYERELDWIPTPGCGAEKGLELCLGLHGVSYTLDWL